MAFQTLKEILDRAIQNEDEANRFYSQAANTVKDPSAKELLNEFAKIELKHKTVLQNFDLSKVDEEHHTVKKAHDLHLSDYLLDKKITPDSSIQDIMIHAMKREQKAYQFFKDMAKVVSSIEVKNLFEDLAAEELDHKGRIETEYDDVIYKEF
ncbi:MAG: ferritin family protein [Planctomycetota bacterium]